MFLKKSSVTTTTEVHIAHTIPIKYEIIIKTSNGKPENNDIRLAIK